MKTDYEKLGLFYLGRHSEAPHDLLLYDSSLLVTHGVVVGMTGSGKTGLCVTLLEEAAIDNIPALVIDPKGDLSNLLLRFPNVSAELFFEGDEARARAEAERWMQQLAAWDQPPERIERLRSAADVQVYTPGSTAARPLALIQSFAAPPPAVRDDPELMRERISSTISGLLDLLGLPADPVKSREHVMLSNLLQTHWKNNRDVSFEDLINGVQNPPFKKVGVLDIDTFYPTRERTDLVLALNNLLAAPGFDLWLQGDSPDLANLLYTPEGRPRISIVSIAHLPDRERMFVVTLLLNQAVAWMRRQSGTRSLRAILFMDEIFGFFPPVANPPSKGPLMTLLKQARAFGLGVLLATQNPVDLDYKGLSNTGTWFIGRLQTERDRDRLLDGLQSAAPSADRARLDPLIASLKGRHFLMHNVKSGQPVPFEVRCALSYLYGPLSREQLKALCGAPPKPHPAVDAPVPPPTVGAGPQTVDARFMPVRCRIDSAALLYRPVLFGTAAVRFADKNIDETREIAVVFPLEDALPEEGQPVDLEPEALESSAHNGAAFREWPAAAARKPWKKEFEAWLCSSQKIERWVCPRLKMKSEPGESEREFRARVHQVARETRDAAVESLRKKYERRIESARDKIRKAEQVLQRESQQASSARMDAAIQVGSTLLSAFFGRRGSVVSSATRAARGVGRSATQGSDVARAQASLAAAQEELQHLESRFQADVEALAPLPAPQDEPLESADLHPRKSHVQVHSIEAVWAPFWMGHDGSEVPAFIPAGRRSATAGPRNG